MKRFYKTVDISTQPPYEILLDGKSIKTPLKKTLSVNSIILAEKIAEEWSKIEDTIQADDMPITQLVSTALDKIDGFEKDIIDQILAYIHGDTLLYITKEDPLLYSKQQEQWLPLIDLMNKEIGAEYQIQETLLPTDQSNEIITFWKQYLEKLDIYELNAFQVGVSLTSSPILIYHIFKNKLTQEDVFTHALLEELHQNELWGTDWEAEDLQKKKKKELEDLSFYIKNLS